MKKGRVIMAKIKAIRDIIAATAEVTFVNQESISLPANENRIIPITSLSASEAENYHEKVKVFMKTNFVEGLDYATLPKCTKPSILKYGAIKVCRYLELIPQPTIITERVDAENSMVSFTVSVSLVDKGGRIVFTGIGFADSREGKFGSATAFNVANTVLKLAKKRALVDAITYYL